MTHNDIWVLEECKMKLISISLNCKSWEERRLDTIIKKIEVLENEAERRGVEER